MMLHLYLQAAGASADYVNVDLYGAVLSIRERGTPAVTVSELNAKAEEEKAEKTEKAEKAARRRQGTESTGSSNVSRERTENQNRRDNHAVKNDRKAYRQQKQQSVYAPPASLRLQYEYELERSREVSSSINRLTILVPILIAAICLILGLVAPMCTNHMPLHLMIIIGIADIITLLAALTVACTVHFYILNPAPSQPEEKEWLAKMKRDLQRGNNWRAWLVFAATLLIYLSVAATLALLIICILGI